MTILLNLLNWAAFALIAIFVLASPWMLGGWEMWYFWPLVSLLFAGAAAGGLRLLLAAIVAMDDDDGAHRPDMPRFARRRFLTLTGLSLPFLIYATVRFLNASVVMDAERIWLLFVTSFLLIVMLWLGAGMRQRRFLFNAIIVSMALQVLYALVAFFVFDDRFIMWAPNIFGYAGRMKGSFFCPNHFSGFLELGLCLTLAVLVDRAASRRTRIAALPVIALCLAGIYFSQSRGGWATTMVTFMALLLWGLRQYPVRRVWALRGAVVLLIIAVTMMVSLTDNPIKRRLHQWHAFNPARRDAEQTLAADVWQRVKLTSRGRQIGGALRAWRSNPVWGIGPGMHQNRWFEFAATADGDRETGQWPSHTNHRFHSYEVHSDWVQLLQEFGIVGFALFVIPGMAAVFYLIGDVRRNARELAEIAQPLAALLAIIAIAFHSIGDFNLQIPGVTWTFAAIIAIGLSASRRSV